jgi:hypothetical protein
MAYRSTGTAGTNSPGGSGNPTGLGLPAGHVLNDILELVIHASDNVVCSVNQGYTLKSAVNSGTTSRQEVWWKRDNGAEVAPTITHTGGDACVARIHAFSGRVTTGDPHSAASQNGAVGSKTGTSTTITPAANDDVLFAVTAAENVSDTSGGTQGWSGYSGTNPTFTERGDTFNSAGLRDLNGAEATGVSDGSATGARTATEGWSYTAASTNTIAGMFALAADVAAGGAPLPIRRHPPMPLPLMARMNSHALVARRQLWGADPSNQTYTLSVDGSTSPSGALVRQPQRSFTGASSPTGALIRQVQRSFTAATSPSGALVRQPQRSLTGATSPTGALVRQVQRALTGATSPSGALIRQVQRSFAGTIAPAGALVRQVQRAFAGTLTSSGVVALTRVILRSFAGAIAPSGAIARQVQRPFAGTIAPTSALVRSVARAFGGSVASSGAIARQVRRTFGAVLGLAGSLLAQLLGAVGRGSVVVGSVAVGSLAIGSIAVNGSVAIGTTVSGSLATGSQLVNSLGAGSVSVGSIVIGED